jgi:Ca2+/H+ antiporter
MQDAGLMLDAVLPLLRFPPQVVGLLLAGLQVLPGAALLLGAAAWRTTAFTSTGASGICAALSVACCC